MLDIVRHGGEREKILIDMAKTYVYLGDYARAEKIFQQNPELLKSKKESTEALLTLAKIDTALCRYRDAEDTLKRVLTMLTGREKKKRIEILMLLSDTYRKTGNLSKAKSVIDEALEIADEEDRDRLMLNLANIEFYRSNFHEALKKYEHVLGSKLAQKNSALRSKILSNIGGVYHSFGKYDKCIEYFKKALEIDKENGYLKGMAIRMNNLGSAYAEMGMYEEAERYFRDALEIDRKLGNRFGEMTKLANLANVLAQQGKVDASIEILEDLIKENRMRGNQLYLVYYELQVAMWLIERDPRKALKYMKECERICLKNQFNGYLVPCYSALALLMKKMGKMSASSKYAKLAEKYLEEVSQIEWNEVEVYYNLYLATGNDEYLRNAYELISKRIESMEESVKEKYMNVPLNRKVREEWERKREN